MGPSLSHYHSAQGNCYVWRFEPGSITDLQPVTMFNAHSKYITRVLLSPDVKCVFFWSAIIRGMRSDAGSCVR